MQTIHAEESREQAFAWFNSVRNNEKGLKTKPSNEHNKQNNIKFNQNNIYLHVFTGTIIICHIYIVKFYWNCVKWGKACGKEKQTNIQNMLFKKHNIQRYSDKELKYTVSWSTSTYKVTFLYSFLFHWKNIGPKKKVAWSQMEKLRWGLSVHRGGLALPFQKLLLTDRFAVAALDVLSLI